GDPESRRRRDGRGEASHPSRRGARGFDGLAAEGFLPTLRTEAVTEGPAASTSKGSFPSMTARPSAVTDSAPRAARSQERRPEACIWRRSHDQPASSASTALNEERISPSSTL